MREIFVTNRNDFHHSDCFDGTEYNFPPNERVALSVDAATHMFGFNLPDKTQVLTRLGWTFNLDRERKIVIDDSGAAKLARFVFTKAILTEVAPDAPDDGALAGEVMRPPDPTVKPGGKLGFLQDATPLV